jgi:hypothetical protein
MKLKCICDNGENLLEGHHSIGFTSNSVFDIALNIEYIAYGACVWRGLVLYLIHDNTDNPNWYPAELFEVIDNQLSIYWKFITYNKDEYSVKAILGYPELLEENHYNGIIERIPNELEIFYEAKAYIDSEISRAA